MAKMTTLSPATSAAKIARPGISPTLTCLSARDARTTISEPFARTPN